MLFVSLFRILKLSWQNFYRNIWLSIAAVTIIILALLSLNFLVTMQIVADQTLTAVKNKVDLSVYFKPDSKADQVIAIRSHLLTLPQVKEVNYTDADQVLKDFQEKHKNDTLILDSLKELNTNPMGAILSIRARNPEDYSEILKALEDPQYQELIDNKNYTDVSLVSESIGKVTDKLKNAGLVLTGIFALIAFLLIFNTIRIAIYTHRTEIGIMKLVGATNGFVRWPFILESAFYGLLGWLITVVILFSLAHFASPYINSFLFDYQMRFDLWSYLWNNFILIFLTQLVAVLIFVSLSSFLAISRYLKV